MKQSKTPPVDLRKVIRAAAEAALEEPTPAVKPKKRRLSAGRALLLGAGAVIAGRTLASQRGNGLVQSLQDRLADLADQPDDNEEMPDVDAAEEQDQAPEDVEEVGKSSNGGAPEDQPVPRRRRGRA